MPNTVSEPSAESSVQPRALKLFAETISTGFGSGRWPFVAPATIGTAAALLVAWAVPFTGDGASPWFFVLIVATFFAGWWACDYVSSPADKDPRRCVIDEWAGVWVTVAFLPFSWPWLLAGFLMFRVLDVLKPFGVRRLESLPGGLGVMADDVGAGLIGAVALNAVYWVFFV